MTMTGPNASQVLCDACFEEGKRTQAYTYLIEGGIAHVRVDLCLEHLSEVYDDHPQWIVRRPESKAVADASPAS